MVVFETNASNNNAAIFGQLFTSGGTLVGTEFLVNTYTSSRHDSPSVACEANGDFVAAWTSQYQDGTYTGIFGQRFAGAGALLGSEFQVTQSTFDDQRDPSVASDADGDFVIAWSSNDQDGDYYDDELFFQRFSSSGARRGDEFRIEADHGFSQLDPSVGADSDGDFVVVWRSSDGDGDGGSVFAQRFNSAGLRRGSEFQVNTQTVNYQWMPRVAMEDEGDFVVAWASYGQDDSVDSGVFAQRFDLVGGRLGVEFQVNTYTYRGQRDPDLCISDDGGRFVVAWASYRQDGSQYGIFAQRYAGPTEVPPTPTPTPLLPPAGGEFQINTHTESSQQDESIACDPDGNFVVAWESYTEYERTNVGVQRFDSAGNPLGTELLLTSMCVDRAGVAACRDMDGNAVAVWEERTSDEGGRGIFGLRFDSTGSAVGTSFQVSTYTAQPSLYPDVACEDGGDFVVVWQSGIGYGDYGVGHDGDRMGIFGQRFTSSALFLGTEFQVNTNTQYSELYPAIAMDGDGAFVVVWEADYNQDGNGSGIFGQRFDSGGAPCGTEFQINMFTNYYQRGPDVSSTADGRFVVVWERYDVFDLGIFGQRFDSTGAASGSEFQINTYGDGRQSMAATAMADDGRFVVAWQSAYSLSG